MDQRDQGVTRCKGFLNLGVFFVSRCMGRDKGRVLTELCFSFVFW